MNRYFKAIHKSDRDPYGMPMCICKCGCSGIDNEDWQVSTEGLHCDQIPEDCIDSKPFAELVAGLLNAYYNDVNIAEWEPERVKKLGLKEGVADIPHPDNPTLPF